MKRVISVLIFSSLSVACQRPPAAQAPQPRTISEQEVKDAIKAVADAEIRGDQTAVAGYLDDGFLATDGTGKVENKQRVLSYVGAFSDSSRVKYDYSDWHIRQLDDVVIAKYRLVSHYERVDGKTKDYLGCVTSVLADRDGKLVTIASHYSELPPERKTVQVSDEILQSYAGKYESPFSGNTYEVSHKDGKLVVGSTKKPGVTFEYEATSETEFYYPGDKATVEFVKGDDGKVTHYVVRSPDIEEPIEVKRVE